MKIFRRITFPCIQTNVNVVNDSAILAGGKAQSLLSQVVEVNIVNKDYGDVIVNKDYVDVDENVNVVNVDSVNEDNPEQGLTSQVVGVINVNEDYVNILNMNIESVCALEVKDNVGVVAVLAIHSVNVNI